MSHYIIHHPTDPECEASYGLDHAIGLFAELRQAALPVAFYDLQHSEQNSVAGLVAFLASRGFFTEAQIENAFSAMEQLWYEDVRDCDFAECALLIERLSSDRNTMLADRVCH